MKLKEKLRLAHLALDVAKFCDFIPDADNIDEETLDEVDFMDIRDVEYICHKYNGYGIDSMQDVLVEISKEFLK